MQKIWETNTSRKIKMIKVLRNKLTRKGKSKYRHREIKHVAKMR